MNAKEIRELFQKHGLEVSRSDIWEVQGNPVIHHKAVERLGVMIGIEWHQPQILRAERDEAVMIVTGKVGERLEWSVGEAAIGQNYRVSGKQAAYVFCMAEKRGRDRVILKLAGLHGAYSEEEADDFKQKPEPPVSVADPERKWKGEYVEGPPSTFVTKGFNTDVTPEQFGAIHATKKSQQAISGIREDGSRPLTGAAAQTIQALTPSKQVYIDKAIKRMSDMESAPELLKWAKNERKMVWPQYEIEPHDEDGQKFVEAYKDRMAVLDELADNPND